MKSWHLDIAVANYNNGKYLGELIESVFNQTNENWRLIIVDDLSTDKSSEIIKPYLSDNRVQLIQHTENKGATATFKTAIEAGVGEIVALLGADDTLPKNCVDRILSYFKIQNGASTIYTQANQCDSNMNYVQLWPHTRPLCTNQPIFEQINSVFNLISFRRKSYEKTRGLNPHLKRAMDHDLIYKLEEVGPIEYLSEPLYNYRVHDAGISQGGKNGQIASQYAFLAKIQCWQRRGLEASMVANKSQEFAQFHLRCLEHRYSYSNESWHSHAIKGIRFAPNMLPNILIAYLRLILKKPSRLNEIHISNLEKIRS